MSEKIWPSCWKKEQATNEEEKTVVFILIAVIVLVMAAGGILKGRGGDADIPAISAAPAERKPLIENITASGTFQPETAEVHLSPGAAQIEAVYKEEGEAVEPGELILQIDDSVHRRALKEAQVALEQVRRTLAQTLLAYRLDYKSQEIARDQARETYNKQLQLFALEAVSQEALNLSRDNLATAEQSFAATRQKLNLTIGLPAEAEPDVDTLDGEAIIAASPEMAAAGLAVEAAREAVDDCRITARNRGFVTRLPAEAGDYVTAGAVVAEVQSLDRMKAVITVDEVDIGKLKEGDEAELTSDSLLGETVPGRVATISPIIETIGNARASRVEILPEDHVLSLRSGASCMAGITTLTKESALTVPVGTVRTQKGKIFVYLLEEQEGGAIG